MEAFYIYSAGLSIHIWYFLTVNVKRWAGCKSWAVRVSGVVTVV